MKAILLALIGISAFGQITKSIILPAAGTAINASVTAQTGDDRIQIEVSNWNNTPGTSIIFPAANGAGFALRFLSLSSMEAYWVAGNAGTGPCVGNFQNIDLTLLPSKDIYISLNGSRSTKTSSVEAYDKNGVRIFSQTCSFSAIGAAPSAGFTLGDSGSVTPMTIAFARVMTGTLPAGGQMPVTAPAGIYAAGCVMEWKFDGNANDSCGSFTATLTGSTSYVSTGALQNLVISVPRGAATLFPGSLARPTWLPTGIGQSMKVGAVNTLDGSDSFSQAAASSVVTYAWSQLQGASAAPSSPTASQPTVTPPSTSACPIQSSCPDYIYRLVVTDTNTNTNTATLEMGAVSMDANHIVTPADSKVTELLGPQIAFGQNPWGYADERNLTALIGQQSYQSTNYDSTWYTPGTGTISSYQFDGKGAAPGPACTTLSAGINSTATTIPVTDASCLSLSSLPTWILIGNTYTSQELVRICATTATTGAANLTVCYDGRGMSGNLTGQGGWANAVPAQAWSMGDIVGEYRINGTSTLFSTDSVRPVCPAGLPGPPGPVVYSTGTVLLTAGSASLVGSGTTWTSAMIGDFIRVSATHASGTPFVFWGQITTWSDATHIGINRPAPTGVDGSAFSYAITGRLYLSLEWTSTIDGHIGRMFQNVVGCESETAMFGQVTHDTPMLHGTTQSGVHYSYKHFLSAYTQDGTFTNAFYGVGLMAESLYQASGYGPAATMASDINGHETRDPELGEGYGGTSPLTVGGPVIEAMMDLVLHPATTLLTWRNVEEYARQGDVSLLSCSTSDTRDAGYKQAWTTLASQYDTNAPDKAAYLVVVAALLVRDAKCKRTVADGFSANEEGSFMNEFSFNSGATPNTLTLTNGSTAITGGPFTNDPSLATPSYFYGQDILTLTVTHNSSAATVFSGTVSAQIPGPSGNLIYFYDGSQVGAFEYSGAGGAGTPIQLAGIWTGASGNYSAMTTKGGPIVSGGQVIGGLGAIWDSTLDWPDVSIGTAATNIHALKKVWAAKYVDATHATLYRPWDGPTGSAYQISYYNTAAGQQQPFMLGIKTSQLRWASLNSNSTIASAASAILPQVGNWLYPQAINLASLGTLYSTLCDICGDPNDIAAGAFNSIHSYQGVGSVGLNAGIYSIARVNTAEAGAALVQYYLASPGPTRKAEVDALYGAMYGLPSMCDASVASTCGSIQSAQLADMYMYASKWPGFHFGMGQFFSRVWPAVRVQGATPTTLSITINGAVTVAGGVRF